MHEQLEKDIAVCTTDSDVMSGPEETTPSELDAIIADYYCKVNESRMQAAHRRHMQGNELPAVFATCIDVCRCTEEEANA